MRNKLLIFFLISIILSGCAGVASRGIFGTGVSVAFDPRTVGTQVDDSIMQKNLSAKIILLDKKYLLPVKTKVLDGRIFLTGKVENPEEKLKLTKLAWETSGARSVKNDIKIKSFWVKSFFRGENVEKIGRFWDWEKMGRFWDWEKMILRSF